MKNYKNVIFFSILFILFFFAGFTSCKVKDSIHIQLPDTYYLEAEVLTQENEDTIFCTEKGDYTVKDKVINPDTEYLLTMTTNGTKDNKDDDICVIWEVVD